MKSKTQAIMAAIFTLILIIIFPLLVAGQSRIEPARTINLNRQER